MKLIDMHCDTISELYKQSDASFAHNHLCVDIEKLKKADSQAQFLACFVNIGKFETKTDRWELAYKEVLSLIERIRQEEGEDFGCIFQEKELEENKKKHCISGIITVEEGGILNDRIERIDTLYKKGVRLLTLTWNYENCIGYPNSRDKKVMENGLKPFGHLVIERMNQFGVLIDVSHISDGGFWDCVQNSPVPVVASHSNARALCPHPRNLSDRMLKAIGEKGGVAGVNFYSAFLTEKKKASISDIAAHARHMLRCAGEDAVAFGTDFDGFETQALPEEIAGIQDMGRIWEALKYTGFTERQLDKIWYKNVQRILRDVWKS
ncbi:dipeptidase [Mediterraneibacter massiliensis]|jgi:membrane dipeptidase|uniref:dipeptidase n=1 Tax=Mediterraneibacter massiliensis TaxID=1720300 RepID=UPI0022E6F410|nr:dipeptidase [Mediterraneibacter massiliensis]